MQISFLAVTKPYKQENTITRALKKKQSLLLLGSVTVKQLTDQVRICIPSTIYGYKIYISFICFQKNKADLVQCHKQSAPFMTIDIVFISSICVIFHLP